MPFKSMGRSCLPDLWCPGGVQVPLRRTDACGHCTCISFCALFPVGTSVICVQPSDGMESIAGVQCCCNTQNQHDVQIVC
jgi:hypothetical protein